MPLDLWNVMCHWHLRMSCAPGTWIISNWSSPHEQSSHIDRSASIGVSEITSLYRWHSPSHVEVFHHGKSAPGCLSHWLAQAQNTQCPPLIHGQSPLSLTVGIHSLWWQHMQSKSLHSTACLKLGGQVLGKCHTFLCCSPQNYQFLYDFWCWTLGSHPMTTDGATG